MGKFTSRRGRHQWPYAARMAKSFLLVAICLLLFLVSLFHGSVDIPAVDVVNALRGEGTDTARYIVVFSRLPQAVTALLSGGALAASCFRRHSAIRWRLPTSLASPVAPRLPWPCSRLRRGWLSPASSASCRRWWRRSLAQWLSRP